MQKQQTGGEEKYTLFNAEQPVCVCMLLIWISPWEGSGHQIPPQTGLKKKKKKIYLAFCLRVGGRKREANRVSSMRSPKAFLWRFRMINYINVFGGHIKWFMKIAGPPRLNCAFSVQRALMMVNGTLFCPLLQNVEALKWFHPDLFSLDLACLRSPECGLLRLVWNLWWHSIIMNSWDFTCTHQIH